MLSHTVSFSQSSPTQLWHHIIPLRFLFPVPYLQIVLCLYHFLFPFFSLRLPFPLSTAFNVSISRFSVSPHYVLFSSLPSAVSLYFQLYLFLSYISPSIYPKHFKTLTSYTQTVIVIGFKPLCKYLNYYRQRKVHVIHFLKKSLLPTWLQTKTILLLMKF
jgi:hypothetical protein